MHVRNLWGVRGQRSWQKYENENLLFHGSHFFPFLSFFFLLHLCTLLCLTRINHYPLLPISCNWKTNDVSFDACDGWFCRIIFFESNVFFVVVVLGFELDNETTWFPFTMMSTLFEYTYHTHLTLISFHLITLHGFHAISQCCCVCVCALFGCFIMGIDKLSFICKIAITCYSNLPVYHFHN